VHTTIAYPAFRVHAVLSSYGVLDSPTEWMMVQRSFSASMRGRVACALLVSVYLTAALAVSIDNERVSAVSLLLSMIIGFHKS